MPSPAIPSRELVTTLALVGTSDGASIPRDSEPLVLPGDAWERRLLVALHGHLPRQRWVAEIVRDKLYTDTPALAKLGPFARTEDLPQTGPVPGLPDWTYTFHGIGCCLTHQNGSTIDVDFDEHGAEGIDPFFYAATLESMPCPQGAEALLRRQEPLERAWMADLDALKALGLLEGRHRVRFTELGVAWAEALGPAISALGSARLEDRMGLARLLDDPLSAYPIDAPPSFAALEPWAREVVAHRASRARLSIRDRRSWPHLLALGALGRDLLLDELALVLGTGPIDGAVSTAIELVDHFGAREFESSLFELAERAAEAGSHHQAISALETVLRQHRADTLSDEAHAKALRILAFDSGPEAAVAGFLEHLLDPTRGLERLGHALHHHAPMARYEAVACLVLIASDEAAAILRGTPTHEGRIGLALLRGEAPEKNPEPEGTWVELGGVRRRTYSAEEQETALAGDLMEIEVARLEPRLGALWRSFWAH